MFGTAIARIFNTHLQHHERFYISIKIPRNTIFKKRLRKVKMGKSSHKIFEIIKRLICSSFLSAVFCN